MNEFHFLLYISVMISAFCQVYLKKIAMSDTVILPKLVHIGFAYTFLMVALGLNMYGLRYVPLTDMAIILPSIFIIIPILSRVLLGEKQTLLHWIGVLIIFLGAVIFATW